MYRPKAFGVTDHDALFAMIERGGFGHLVTFGMHGYTATGLPWVVDRERGPCGTLRGHLARANPHWKRIGGDVAASALVLFQLTDGYVTPSWYPSKVEHGEVVPTWDYEVVQVHGRVSVHDDVEWLRTIVTDLTDRHESAQPSRSGTEPWAVTDAPGDFVDKMLRAIVGVEVEIEFLDGVRKLSQNRPEADVSGVVAGLDSSPDPADRALAEQVREAAS